MTILYRKWYNITEKSSVVYGVKYNDVEKISYTYDNLMRRTDTTINTTNPFVTTYGYKDITLDKTTTQLNSISYSNGKGFVYTYDANGNILTIKDQNNTLLANYTYDSLNQLTREDNAQLNKSITYTYDNGGNILSVKEYAFTTGTLGSVVNEKTYTYGNSEWKDLLTNYNGTNISYDTIGNPTNWINGETFEWSAGRQLTGVTKGDNTISYTYNDDGIRTSKVVNGITTSYYLNGTTVIMQKTGSNRIWFTYDENDLVTGFRYNSNEYYYIKNVQSDIIGIIDSSGTVVANYTYDSWGKHVSITDGNGNDVSGNVSHIANINPFRYRGYYFDNETGLYYLNSRYYDSNVGRFLNADGYTSTGQGVIGNNMFAYCGNNPANCKDPSGNGWITALIIAVVVTAVVSAVKNEIYAAKNYKENSKIDADPDTTTKNKIVNDQNGTTGEKFTYGRHPASYNACETIAIHNAKVLLKKESTLSETMRDTQISGAMPLEGVFGSNPYALGAVLEKSDLTYSKVNLNSMTQSGVYVISYWTGTPLFTPLHTVAVKYDGIQYTTYNLQGYGAISYELPSKYAKRFICGYYLGE